MRAILQFMLFVCSAALLTMSPAASAQTQPLDFVPGSFNASYTAGDTINVQWTGGDPSWTVNISIGDVAAWQSLSVGQINATPNDGAEPFTIGAQLPPGTYLIYMENTQRTDWKYGPHFTVSAPPPPVPVIEIHKTVDGCGFAPSAGDVVCQFRFEVTSDIATTIADVNVIDFMSTQVSAYTVDLANTSPASCSITANPDMNSSPVLVPIATEMGGAPGTAAGCGELDSVAISPSNPLVINASVQFDPSTSSTSPVRNCAALVWDGLSAAPNLPLPQSCIDVPVPQIACSAPPAGMTFWAQFDTVLGPDAVGGMESPNAAGPPRQLVATDISGHAGAFLRRSGNGSRVVFARPASGPTPWGFRRGDFSIDAWVRIPTSTAAQASYGTIGIVDTRNAGATAVNGISLFSSNHRLAFMMATDTLTGQYRTWISQSDIADGNWHHVAATVRRNSDQGGTLYVDGVPVPIIGVDLGDGSVTTLPGDLYFDPTPISGQLGAANTMGIGVDRGHIGPNGAGEEDGGFDIDEIEAFNRVLTSSEVAGLYALPKCR